MFAYMVYVLLKPEKF
ncbi:potassium-transporting ATPase subunit F [Mucilaginibacter conchicola]